MQHCALFECRSSIGCLPQLALEEKAELQGKVDLDDAMQESMHLNPECVSCLTALPCLAAVSTFSTEGEAVQLANDSEFGLAGAVISADEARCKRVAEALQVGIVWVNCSQPCFCQVRLSQASCWYWPECDVAVLLAAHCPHC